jgi:hypothetical protein
MPKGRKATEQRSELQKAADRVREIQEAVDIRQEHLAVCKREVEQCKLAYDEALRNYGDAESLLGAQFEKLYREKKSVLTLLGYGNPLEEKMECAKVQRTY